MTLFAKKTPAQVELTAESLISELLAERKKDRRAGLIKTAFVAVGALAYFGWMALVFMPAGISTPDKPFAAVVKISGPIGPGKEASYEELAPLLRMAFENPKARGVVLSINSPGGTPVQSSLIHDLIVQLKHKHKKPVVAVGEDMMTSGAYFIAVAADNVVVNRSTVTGSIGVISAGFGFTGLMDKLGIERRVATAGESKNLLDPFSPSSERSVEKQRELLTAIHGHFKDVVKEGRGDRLALDTPGLFEGNVWTGEDAVKLGVVDGLGDVQSAIKKYFEVETSVTLTRRKPMFESLLDTIGVKMMATVIESQTAVPMATYK